MDDIDISYDVELVLPPNPEPQVPLPDLDTSSVTSSLEMSSIKGQQAHARHQSGNIAMTSVRFIGNVLNHVHTHRELDGHRSLLSLARDTSTPSAVFLEAATAHPEELSMTDEFNTFERGHSAVGLGDYTPFSFAASVLGNDAEEKALTPLHIFFSHAGDLSFYEIFTLHGLDQNCLTRFTSYCRTPVHHLFEKNERLQADVLDALHKCDPKCFVRLDRKSNTPLDRYFKHQPSSKLDISDAVVRILCEAPGSWGIVALSRSTDAYRSKSNSASTTSSLAQEYVGVDDGSNAELPNRFRHFLTGTPYEVESFVRELMVNGETDLDIIANIKFLFVLIPLRSPAKYGLNATQGIQLISRIIHTCTNIYSFESGEKADHFKRCWLSAFSDCALSMIQDEGLLNGMLSGSPSKKSVETLSSTPFMQTVLTFKFRSGPFLIFYAELALFGFLCTLILGSILESTSSLVTGLFGLGITAYFTLRELHHMWDLRAKEIELTTEEHSSVDEKRRRRSSIAGEALREARGSLKTADGTPNWRQNPTFRRMSLKFGKSETQEITLGEDESDKESEDFESDLTQGSKTSTRWTLEDCLERLSYFITVYFGLAEAWR